MKPLVCLDMRLVCTCKYRLDASICNDKKPWNNDKCRCECKELTDKGNCGDGFIYNLSLCECKYDKSCDVGEYLDYVSCKYRKRLIEKLVEKLDEKIDRNETTYNTTLSKYEGVYRSCRSYETSIIACIMIIRISSACFYFYRCMKGNYLNVLSY